MGVPSVGTRSDTQCHAMRRMQERYKDQIEFVYPETYVQRIFHDFARNEIVKEFLATDCDVLWFLDADVTPHQDTMELITEHFDKWMLAGCAYPIWLNSKENNNEPQVYFTIYQETQDGGLGYTKTMGAGTGFVGGLATGCIFIKRGVLEILEEPYFEFKFDEKTRFMKEGEDIGFCLKVNKLGYQFFVDHSLLARHHKTVDLLDVSNYAINYSNAKYHEYDAVVRPRVIKLQEEIKKLKEKLKDQMGSSKNQSKLILPNYDPR